MLFQLLVAGASVLIGFLRGGRFNQMPDLQRLWLPPVAAALQMITAFFPGTIQAMAVMILSYLLLIGFVVCNGRLVGLRLLVVGLGLNLLVITANGGRMPVSMESVDRSGLPERASMLLLAGLDPKHRPMAMDSGLAFLGDVIPLKYPVPQVLSIGDIFILLGAVVLVQESMGKPVGLFGPGEPS